MHSPYKSWGPLAAATTVGVILVGGLLLSIRATGYGTATHQAAATTGNPTQDRLVARGASDQALILGLVAGEGCLGESVFFMGMDKIANANWSVRCHNGRSYQIEIRPDADGSTSTMDCRILKAMVDEDCFESFERQEAAPPRLRTKRQLKDAFNKLPPALRKEVHGDLRRALDSRFSSAKD